MQQSKRRGALSNASLLRGTNSYDNDDNNNNDNDDNNNNDDNDDNDDNNATMIAMVRNNNDDNAPSPRPRNADSIPAPVSIPSMAPQHAACNLEDNKHDKCGEEEDNGGGERHCQNEWQSIAQTTSRLQRCTLAS
jgi:hypothetical protein